MKPRAVVFDLFGDHLRYLGGEARLQALTELLEVFGVGGNTARVVLSRMRKEGWFTTRRERGATVYTLTEQSWRLLDEGRDRIFARTHQPWDGAWRMVIYEVPEPNRPERDRLRRTLTWFGFGPLTAATWVSPHDRLDEVEARFADTPARLDLLTCTTRGHRADLEMARRCWDLGALAADYERLIGELTARPSAKALAKTTGPQALRQRIELVASYRAFPFRDPDLPAALLPDGWPGARAHELFLQVHDALAAPSEAFVREVIGRSGA